MPSEKICISTCDCTGISMEQMNAILTSSEKDEYERTPVSKRQEWLGGRISAKKVIQEYLKAKHSVLIPVTEIELIKQEGKVPLCKVTSSKDDCVNVDDILLSISHSHEYAVACAIDKSECNGLGVDTERIRSFNESTLRGFLTDEEYKIYLKTSEKSKDMVATRYWCIKEAYLKAKGVGLRFHPQHIFVDMENPKNILIYEDGMCVEAEVRWTIKNDLYILVTVLL